MAEHPFHLLAKPVGQRCEVFSRLKQACFSRSGIRENSLVRCIDQNSYEYCYKNVSQRCLSGRFAIWTATTVIIYTQKICMVEGHTGKSLG